MLKPLILSVTAECRVGTLHMQREGKKSISQMNVNCERLNMLIKCWWFTEYVKCVCERENENDKFNTHFGFEYHWHKIRKILEMKMGKEEKRTIAIEKFIEDFSIFYSAWSVIRVCHKNMPIHRWKIQFSNKINPRQNQHSQHFGYWARLQVKESSRELEIKLKISFQAEWQMLNLWSSAPLLFLRLHLLRLLLLTKQKTSTKNWWQILIWQSF